MRTKQYLFYQFIGTLIIIAPLGIWWLHLESFSRLLFFIAVSIAYLSSTLSYLILNANLQKRMAQFSQSMLAGVMLKLLAGILSITVIALQYKAYALLFVFTYFISYFIYTAFEVYALMRKLRRNLNKKEDDASK